MLVLRRKVGESVSLGDSVRVVVLDARRNEVRLGFEAPPSVRIARDDLYAEACAEARRAARVPRAEMEEEVEPFVFPEGILGFAYARRFALLYPGRGNIACLQSVDAMEVALLVAPWDEARLGPVPGGAEELAARLGGAPDAWTWLVPLNPFADPCWVMANLSAPIAINPHTRRGGQWLNPDPSWPMRFPWQRKPQRSGPTASA